MDVAIYVQEAEPICIITSSPCTGLAGWAALNHIINPKAWEQSRSISVPLGNLAGDLALHQLRNKRHFVCENPKGSDLYKLPVWQRVF